MFTFIEHIIDIEFLWKINCGNQIWPTQKTKAVNIEIWFVSMWLLLFEGKHNSNEWYQKKSRTKCSLTEKQ